VSLPEEDSPGRLELDRRQIAAFRSKYQQSIMRPTLTYGWDTQRDKATLIRERPSVRGTADDRGSRRIVGDGLRRHARRTHPHHLAGLTAWLVRWAQASLLTPTPRRKRLNRNDGSRRDTGSWPAASGRLDLRSSPLHRPRLRIPPIPRAYQRGETRTRPAVLFGPVVAHPSGSSASSKPYTGWQQVLSPSQVSNII
jgi:hypothetical protein